MNRDSARSETLRIATRGSRLARWQAEWVAARLRGFHPGLEVLLVEIKTQGDRDQHSPLAMIGGTGLFTKEIQRAVLDGTADVAVHSLKDLPTQGPRELVLAAVPQREDVADALIAPVHRTLQGLPSGARVGTSSITPPGPIALPAPGPGRGDDPGERRDPIEPGPRGEARSRDARLGGLAPPGPGPACHPAARAAPVPPRRGAGGPGHRVPRGRRRTRQLLIPLDHPATHRAVAAERAALADLEGGCIIPMGAWARDAHPAGEAADFGLLALDAAVFDPDGRERIFAAETGPLDAPEDPWRPCRPGPSCPGRRTPAPADQGADRLARATRRIRILGPLQSRSDNRRDCLLPPSSTPTDDEISL